MRTLIDFSALGAAMAPYHLLAAAFALLLPFLLFVSRALVRQQRSAAFQDLMHSLFPQGGSLPQLDLVGAKYDSPSVDKKPGDTTRRKRQSNGPMLAAAVFGLLTFAGFELLLVPISALMEYATSRLPNWQFAVAPAFIWTNGGAGAQALNNAVAIAGMAFLGAYIAAARFLAKQAWNFELDAMSLLRSTLLLIMGVVIALVAYRTLSVSADKLAETLRNLNHQPTVSAAPAVPTTTGASSETATPTTPAPPAQPRAMLKDETPVAAWLGIAFLIGYAPESGLALLTRRLRMRIQKSTPDDLYKRFQIAPVEIIDGIDSEVAYRLEQHNLEDIQNLATANPVEVYLETPFGFFEVFDWILQAQLCLVVGPDTFLDLKRAGIRTIFDLERAVLAKGVPDTYVQAVGEILFQRAIGPFRLRLGGSDTPISVAAVRHAVAVSCDDLHTHRLRALWHRVFSRTSEPDEPKWLYTVEALPGD